MTNIKTVELSFWNNTEPHIRLSFYEQIEEWFAYESESASRRNGILRKTSVRFLDSYGIFPIYQDIQKIKLQLEILAQDDAVFAGKNTLLAKISRVWNAAGRFVLNWRKHSLEEKFRFLCKESILSAAALNALEEYLGGGTDFCKRGVYEAEQITREFEWANDYWLVAI